MALSHVNQNSLSLDLLEELFRRLTDLCLGHFRFDFYQAEEAFFAGRRLLWRRWFVF